MVNKWSYPLRMLALPDALGLSSRRETRKGLWPTVGVIVFSIGQCSRRTSLYKAGLPVNKRDHVFCILIPLFQTSLFDKASVAQTKSGFASHPTNDQDLLPLPPVRTTMALYPTGGFVVFIWMPTGGLDDPLHGAEQACGALEQPAARKIAGSIGVRGPKWINLRIAEIVHLEAEAVRILLTALQRVILTDGISTLEKKQIAKGIRDLTIRSIWSCWNFQVEERLWYGRKSKTLPDLLEELIFGMAPVMRELRQCQLPKLLCGLGKALKDLLDGRTLHLHPIMQGDVCRFAKTKELALRKKALLLQRVMKWDATHCEPSICKKTIIHKLSDWTARSLWVDWHGECMPAEFLSIEQKLMLLKEHASTRSTVPKDVLARVFTHMRTGISEALRSLQAILDDPFLHEEWLGPRFLEHFPASSGC
ncbi:unnamed protein product [Durusdinium trenchii]|uniref:Uncharacterized protein n=1 Tax=Durusdinium trenchii TaxID=1381693 RepID=A0ABP0NB43_9DINO